MQAIIHTNLGDITVELFPFHAPATVKSFTGLATGERTWTHPVSGEESSEPLYNGTIFHRVIPGFMIQGGDPLGAGFGGPGYAFDDEIHPELAFNEPYLLAMANSGKRAGRGTNGSQFFITTSRTPHLQGKHTIFGKVADQESKAVVDAISATPTGPNPRVQELAGQPDPGSDTPVEDIVISSIDIIE